MEKELRKLLLDIPSLSAWERKLLTVAILEVYEKKKTRIIYYTTAAIIIGVALFNLIFNYFYETV